MGGVHPDRRGLAPGARWQVDGENKPTILRRPEAVGYLIVVAVEPRRAVRVPAHRRPPRRRAHARARGPAPDDRVAEGRGAVARRPLAGPAAPRAPPPLRPGPDRRDLDSGPVFDLRYHVASLAAVFIALVLGILVGVGISGRGLDQGERARRAPEPDRRPAEPARRRAAPGRRAERAPGVRARDIPGRDARTASPTSGSRSSSSGRPRATSQRESRETLARAGAPGPRVRALKVPIVTGRPAAAPSPGSRTRRRRSRTSATGSAAEFVRGADAALGRLGAVDRRGARAAQAPASTPSSSRARPSRSRGRPRASSPASTPGSRPPASRPSASRRSTTSRRPSRSTADTASRPWTTSRRRPGGSRSRCSSRATRARAQYGVKDGVDAVLPHVEPVTTPQRVGEPLTILVAARDEEDTIGETVRALRAHFPTRR